MAKYNIEDLQLGDTVKDTVTGFTGVAVARTAWLMSCDRIYVQPPVNKDGEHSKAQEFDLKQLVITKKATKALLEASGARTGGPTQSPSRASTR
jgi:hypothetical protein